MRASTRLASLAAVAILYAACVPEHSTTGPYERTPPTFSIAGETPQVVLTAGNIGDCNSTRDDATASILDNQPGTVLTLGDNAFEYGTSANYTNCYAPTWGRQLSRTYATLGNHDYAEGNASGSFGYFGSAHLPGSHGYYSLDLGYWHVIVLNDAGQYSPTNSYSPWYSGSPMESWLRSDLAAHSGRCTLVSFHVPLYLSSNTSGYTYNSDHRLIWDDLYAAHVDVVLNGQEHWYERMAPQRPDATPDAAGIREFIVGTAGGDGLIMPTVAIQKNSQVRGATPGVLRLTLYSDHYGWQFLPVAGQTFSDTGSTYCHTAATTTTSPPPPPPPTTTDTGGVVLAGAGSIARCDGTNDDATANLVAAMPGYVFTAGDNAFPHGASTDYSNCYGPTWGKVLSRTLPALGNHDYDTGGAAGAFGYFGSKLGPSGYYSTTVGAWHVVVLNDNIAFASGSAQESWLRSDLAAHPAKCTLAIWHHPRFFSSTTAGWNSDANYKILWDDLAAAHADVVINGHQYDYERMAPMDPDGTRDDTGGIRQFNVGTGGYSVYTPSAIAPNSQALAAAFGVLKLTLFSDHYTWQFVPIPGQSYTDSGTGSCH